MLLVSTPRIQFGTERDGKKFLSYRRGYDGKVYEVWVSPESFDRIVEQKKSYAAKNRDLINQRAREKRRSPKKPKATPRDAIAGSAVRTFYNVGYRAAKKGLEFYLTREWIEAEIRKGKCSLTGVDYQIHTGTTGRKENRGIVDINPWAPSIDRIDSSKGYTIENCRVVSWMFNRAKGTYTDKEFQHLISCLLKNKYLLLASR